MAKRIYAGSDIFLMPSQFEPCGLGQMISLRFGTIPLVRETGGLADTVENFDSKTGEGNGFVFKEYTTEAFLKAIDRALGVYRDPKLWSELVKNGMKCDFSWRSSAKHYLELYERVERKPLLV
jgi:starch synthase